MKMPKQYNVTPAKGQALLNFQGRRFPDKVDLFEAEVIEEMRNTKAKQQSLKMGEVFVWMSVSRADACVFTPPHPVGGFWSRFVASLL